MSENASATRPNPFGIVSKIDEPERLLSPTVRPSYHTAMEPSAYDSATTDASNATFVGPEPQHKAINSVNQAENINPSCSANVDQVSP